jgi:rhodanese-related sulfurtransferase
LPASLVILSQVAAADVPSSDEYGGGVLAHPEVERISSEELKQLIDEDVDIVIVDSRDGLSYEYGHIEGAINIYYDPTGDPAIRAMTLVALPADKLIVLYCP